MKKIFLIGAIISTLLLFTVSAYAIDGDGSEENPYQITSQEELELINNSPNSHYILMNDIEIEDIFVPLCRNNIRNNIIYGFTGNFDGNGHTISNLQNPLFYYNQGIIKNLYVVLKSANLASSTFMATGTQWDSYYSGGIVCYNSGCISSCMVEGTIISKSGYSYNHGYMYCIGGITGCNTGTIMYCRSSVNIYPSSGYYYSTYEWNALGGIASGGSGTISNCYFTGTIYYPDAYQVNDVKRAGIVVRNAATVKNCYSINIAITVGANVNTINSFSGATNMKTKELYTDAGWDFDNVWGISPDINDGYPYLLWEHPEEKSSASTEIINAISAGNSLKFISEVSIEGDPEISAFGTAFIPLWLFEAESADTSIVEYDNSEYNISDKQTYGAILQNIPESCKDMDIVGKSFIRDSEGNYTWSAAKYSSFNDTELKNVQ